MPLNWIDVHPLSINHFLLLERVQLSWMPGWLPETELAVVLRAHPHIDWFMRHKCPAIAPWLDRVLETHPAAPDADLRSAELTLLNEINDLLVYAIDPAIYERLPFTAWDDRELTSLADFNGKIVLDIGAGPGRLTFAVAGLAKTVFAVEPVDNLRRFIREKAAAHGLRNVFAVDGLLTAIPFPDDFADIVMGGHVFGDDPASEIAELERVTRPGGTVVLMPGNVDTDNAEHAALLAAGYQWAVFVEPPADRVRKYWKTLP